MAGSVRGLKDGLGRPAPAGLARLLLALFLVALAPWAMLACHSGRHRLAPGKAPVIGFSLDSLVVERWQRDLDLFSRGGLEILRAIERQDYDVLSARPAISKANKFKLALRAVSGKLLPFLALTAGA